MSRSWFRSKSVSWVCFLIVKQVPDVQELSLLRASSSSLPARRRQDDVIQTGSDRFLLSLYPPRPSLTVWLYQPPLTPEGLEGGQSPPGGGASSQPFVLAPSGIQSSTADVTPACLNLPACLWNTHRLSLNSYHLRLIQTRAGEPLWFS